MYLFFITKVEVEIDMLKIGIIRGNQRFISGHIFSNGHRNSDLGVNKIYGFLPKTENSKFHFFFEGANTSLKMIIISNQQMQLVNSGEKNPVSLNVLGNLNFSI